MASEEAVKILEEFKKFHSNAFYQRTKEVLSKEILKIESEIAAKQKANEEPKTTLKSASPRVVTEISEHAFDESDKYVKIFIPFNATGISDDNVELELTDNSFCLTIKGDNKDYRFNVRNLLKPVDIAKSYKKVKTDMVSVYLKKVKEGDKWIYLTTTEKRLKEQKNSAFDLDDKNGSKDDPMGGLMNVMKKLYDSGDADMKRNIAKAWTEGQEKSKQNPMF